MSPSKESDLLRQLFITHVQNSPKSPNPPIERALYDQIHRAATEVPAISYEDIVLPSNIPAKWVRPSTTTSKKPKTCILFLHGGGYTFGSLESHRKMCAHLSLASNCDALMVDYRMTPEYPFPAALDDCVDAYKWLLDQGYEGRNIATMGDSCGGALATSVSLKIIRNGWPKPGAAVAMSPWYDVVGKESASMRTNSENDVLQTAEFVQGLAKRYCAGGARMEDPLISPIYAEEDEVKGLPPHWISCGGYDMLLDDGKRFAEKLEKAGVETVLQVHEQQQHVMEFMAGRAPEADASVRKIGEWVKKKLGS